jgi:hypothetical protein
MKFISIFILVICTFTASAQSVSRIKQLLSARDLVGFESCIDSARHLKTKAETYIWVRSKLKRELCSPFQELIVEFNENVYEEPKIGVSYINHYRINVIIAYNQFAYYTLRKQIARGIEDENAEMETIDSFKNDSAIDSLEVVFLQTYGAKLDWKELFVNRNIYGKWCGVAGSPPAMRKELDTLLADKNQEVLTNWLKSPNVEKQVYAIDGFYQLKQNGYKQTGEQQKLIDVIKKKKGQINTCSGCFYESSWIDSTVTSIISGRDF